MSRDRCLQIVCSSAMLAFAVIAHAEERTDVAKGEAAAQDKPEEVVWRFEDEGLRDPFTFVKLEIKEKSPEEKLSPAPKPQTSPNILEQLKIESEHYYNLAEEAFMRPRPADAVALCDKGLESFKAVTIDNEPELQAIREKLFRLRRAADRLKSRTEAETAFRAMNLRVSGVVARPKKSQAIINNQVLGRGDLITTQEDAAIVDRILPGRVVMRFRGYQMEVAISQ